MSLQEELYYWGCIIGTLIWGNSQMAPSGSLLYTLGSKVGIIRMLEALGKDEEVRSVGWQLQCQRATASRAHKMNVPFATTCLSGSPMEARYRKLCKQISHTLDLHCSFINVQDVILAVFWTPPTNSTFRQKIIKTLDTQNVKI